MPPFVMLTQDRCADCERLKIMLSAPLRGKFADRIRTVHRESDAAEFDRLVAEHGVMKAPALIEPLTGRVLRNTASMHEVRQFLNGGAE